MNRTKRLLTATVAAAFAGLQSFAGNDLTMIVGTYTDQITSEGMYVYRFNQDNGKSEAVSSIKSGNPSFLIFNDNDSGKLTNTHNDIKLGKPVCIQFADKNGGASN